MADLDDRGWAVWPLRDGRQFRLFADYTEHVWITPRAHRLRDVQKALQEFAGSYVIEVPGGFVFDGSSTPRLFWGIAPPMTGRHVTASLVHDWLYVTKMIMVADKRGPLREEGCPRELADLIFLEIMRRDGVDRDLAEMMWGAVRNHGGSAWADKD